MRWVVNLNQFPLQKEKPFEMVARTNAGLEEELVKELKACGATEIRIANRAVLFKGDLGVMYKANLSSRLALRILVPWVKFRAKTPEELYETALDLPFSELMGIEQTFAIDATVHSTLFTHSKYASLKLKDALADHFRKHFDKRPDVELDEPDFRFNLFIQESDVTILLDSSGDSLHKRGYRMGGGLAPLNEVLAAGMLKLAGYTGDEILVDPMCGSGTILTEALLIASNQIPQFSRSYFGFIAWKEFEEEEYKSIRNELMDHSHPPKFPIRGFEIDEYQLAKARENQEELKFGEEIELHLSDFFELNAENEEGLIVMNPPYGERLGLDEAIDFYDQIGTAFKHKWPGWKAWVISSNLKALKRLGLKPFKKHILFNGPLECRFQGYEMFKGALRDVKAAQSAEDE